MQSSASLGPYQQGYDKASSDNHECDFTCHYRARNPNCPSSTAHNLYFASQLLCGEVTTVSSVTRKNPSPENRDKLNKSLDEMDIKAAETNTLLAYLRSIRFPVCACKELESNFAHLTEYSGDLRKEFFPKAD